MLPSNFSRVCFRKLDPERSASSKCLLKCHRCIHRALLFIARFLRILCLWSRLGLEQLNDHHQHWRTWFRIRFTFLTNSSSLVLTQTYKPSLWQIQLVNPGCQLTVMQHVFHIKLLSMPAPVATSETLEWRVPWFFPYINIACRCTCTAITVVFKSKYSESVWGRSDVVKKSSTLLLINLL